MLKNKLRKKIPIQHYSPPHSESSAEENISLISQHPKKILGIINQTHAARFFYVISGSIVIFALVVMINIYGLHLKVTTAVVSAPVESMVAPVSGFIADVFVASGEHIKKGSALLRIENITLERELQLAQVQVEESQLLTNYYQQRLKNEQQRLIVYKKISKTRAISAQSHVNVSKQLFKSSQQNLNRFKALHKKGYISETDFEQQHTNYIAAQEQLNQARSTKRQEQHALKAIEKGMYFTGNKTEGIEQDLYAKLDAARQKTELNKHRVKIYQHLISKLTLTAPFDGNVLQIIKSLGNTTDNIKPIILIERADQDKQIIAYLTQEEVTHIGSSKTVKIYLPSLSKTYQGRILTINRTDGFVDEIKAQYRWRDFQIDRSALVTISILKNEALSFNTNAFSGMPAIVYFPKNIHII